MFALVANQGMLYEPMLDDGEPTAPLLETTMPDPDVFLPGGYQPRIVGGYLEHTVRLNYQTRLWPEAAFANPYTWRRIYFTIESTGIDSDSGDDTPNEVGPLLLVERGAPLGPEPDSAA